MPAPASQSHDPAAVRQQAAALIAVRILLYLGGMSSYFIGVLGTLTFTLGGGVFDNAIAVGLLNLFMTFGSMQSGALLDRLGMRAHFRICASSLVVIGLLYQVLARSVPGLYLGAALFGYAMGAADVIPRSYPAYLTDRVDELKRINSGITVATNVSIIVGPLVGGAIATVAPTQTVFLFMTACSLLAFVPAAVMRPLRTLRQGGGEGGKDRPGALYGFKSIRSSRVLNLLFWCTMLSFLGYGAFDPLESLFYRDVLRVGASWMGWLSALSGVGGIVGAFAVGAIPRHHVNVRTLLTVLALSGGGSLLYVSTSDVRIACAGQLALGFFFAAFGPIKDTLIQVHTPLENIGRVNAAMTAGFNFAGVVPLFAAPALAAMLGVQGTLVAAGVTVTLVPICLFLVKRKQLQIMVAQERAYCGREPGDGAL